MTSNFFICWQGSKNILPCSVGESSEKRLEGLEQRAALKRGRKPQVTLTALSPEDQVCLSDLLEEKRIIEGIHDVAGHVYDQIGYGDLLSSKKDQEMLKNLVLMRLANPSNKYSTQQILDKQFNICHDLDALYRIMDKLYPVWVR